MWNLTQQHVHGQNYMYFYDAAMDKTTSGDCRIGGLLQSGYPCTRKISELDLPFIWAVWELKELYHYPWPRWNVFIIQKKNPNCMKLFYCNLFVSFFFFFFSSLIAARPDSNPRTLCSIDGRCVHWATPALNAFEKSKWKVSLQTGSPYRQFDIFAIEAAEYK